MTARTKRPSEYAVRVCTCCGGTARGDDLCRDCREVGWFR